MPKTVVDQESAPSVCCAPAERPPLSAEAAQEIAVIAKALADPVRLQLLSLVFASKDGEACVCDLVDSFELSQPTISHHLKVLYEIGLLDRSKRGVWVYYSPSRYTLTKFAAAINSLSPVS